MSNNISEQEVYNYLIQHDAKDLSDDELDHCFRGTATNHFLMKAISMREQGILCMENSKIKLQTCYENPEIVKINFPLGSKQRYHNPSHMKYYDVDVVGYGFVIDNALPHISNFVVMCRRSDDMWANVIAVHPNKFEQ